jgi:hypothetical protein
MESNSNWARILKLHSFVSIFSNYRAHIVYFFVIAFSDNLLSCSFKLCKFKFHRFTREQLCRAMKLQEFYISSLRICISGGEKTERSLSDRSCIRILSKPAVWIRLPVYVWRDSFCKKDVLTRSSILGKSTKSILGILCEHVYSSRWLICVKWILIDAAMTRQQGKVMHEKVSRRSCRLPLHPRPCIR